MAESNRKDVYDAVELTRLSEEAALFDDTLKDADSPELRTEMIQEYVEEAKNSADYSNRDYNEE